MFTYRCRLVRVVDGDTVDIDIDLGFNHWLMNQRIRLYGVNTPETRTRDLDEKARGLAAKAFVEDFLDDEKLILTCREYNETGKFGRILGSLYRTTNHNELSVNEVLIEKGHGVAYFGGKR